MISRRRLQDGFSLLEVLISMAVFSIGSLGVLALVSTSIKLNASSHDFGEASLLGQWKLDELASSPLTSAVFTNCTTVSPTNAMCHADGAALNTQPTSTKTIRLSDIGARGSTGVRYQVLWSAAAITTGPETGIRAIDVRVLWPRDKNVAQLPFGAAGFVDCSQPTAAGAGACHIIEFHSYRSP